jgi:hypothetical protein
MKSIKEIGVTVHVFDMILDHLESQSRVGHNPGELGHQLVLGHHR